MKNNSNESRIFELVGKIVIKEAEKKIANESLEEDVLVVQGDFTSRVTRDAKEIEAGIVQFAGNLC